MKKTILYAVLILSGVVQPKPTEKKVQICPKDKPCYYAVVTAGE